MTSSSSAKQPLLSNNNNNNSSTTADVDIAFGVPYHGDLNNNNHNRHNEHASATLSPLLSPISSPEIMWTPAPPIRKKKHIQLAPNTPMVTTSAMRASVPPTEKGVFDISKHDVLVLVCAGLVALFSSTVQVMNIYSTKLQNDTHTSSLYVAILQGVGVMGLQFTLVQGRVLDLYGCYVLCCASAVLVVGGYYLMSITHNEYLLMFEFLIVAVGCGGTFLSSLSTAIAIGNPLGIGWVSVLMSLCASWTVFITDVYGNEVHCGTGDTTPNSCWRKYVRMYAVTSAVAFFIGSFGFYYYRHRKAAAAQAKQQEYTPLLTPPNNDNNGSGGGGGGGAKSASHTPPQLKHASSFSPATSTPAAPPPPLQRSLSIVQSLEVFKTRFFWTFFYAMTVGIGSGIFVITQAKQLWDAYNMDPSRANWNLYISSGFSIVTATTNVVAPLLSDYLHKAHIMRANVFLALLFSIVCTVYVVLGIIIALPHRTPTSGVMYAVFLALTGFGFGSFLVLIPNTVGKHYPIEHFGTYMSYMQFGAAVFAIGIPTLSSAIHTWTGHYDYMVWAFVVMTAIASAGVYSIRIPRRLRKVMFPDVYATPAPAPKPTRSASEADVLGSRL